MGNLNRRIQKLEEEAGIDEQPDPRVEERRRVLYDPEFIRNLFTTANNILASLERAHYLLIERDILLIREWHVSEDRGDYPDSSAMTRFFLDMLCDALEGLYKGPLSIPPVIAQYLAEQKHESCWSHHECEQCFYPVPFVTGKPFCPDGGSVRSGHCPLCGGDVSISAVPNSPSAPYYQRVKMRKRDSGGAAIVTGDALAWILSFAMDKKVN